MPGRRAGMPGRRAGMPGRRPGMPGRRPGMPGRRPGMPGRRPGMPGRRPGMPGRRPGMRGGGRGCRGGGRGCRRRPGMPGRRPGMPGRRACGRDEDCETGANGWTVAGCPAWRQPPASRVVPLTGAWVREPGAGSAESAWSAVPALPLARFSRPLAEPAVHLSAQRALHGFCRQAFSTGGQDQPPPSGEAWPASPLPATMTLGPGRRRRHPAARLAALQPPSLLETAAALPHVPGSPRLGVLRRLRPARPVQRQARLSRAAGRMPAAGNRDRAVPAFTVVRSAKEEPGCVPAASPQVRRRPSPWPAGAVIITTPEVPAARAPAGRAAPGPDPPGSSRCRL